MSRSGAPVAGTYVTIRLDAPMEDGSPFGAYAQTDTGGRYSMRMIWFGFRPLTGTRPDSAMVWVYATQPTQIGQPKISDSVRVMARFAAVGSRAPGIAVPVLTLPLP